MTINHVHLAAKDVAATQAFYERYFGFRMEAVHGEGLFLRDEEGFLIALDPTSEPVQFPSWFHLGFCQNSPAAVHAIFQEVQSGGGQVIRKLFEEPGEFASFFVADPDGVRIEVSWHAA